MMCAVGAGFSVFSSMRAMAFLNVSSDARRNRIRRAANETARRSRVREDNAPFDVGYTYPRNWREGRNESLVEFESCHGATGMLGPDASADGNGAPSPSNQSGMLADGEAVLSLGQQLVAVPPI